MSLASIEMTFAVVTFRRSQPDDRYNPGRWYWCEILRAGTDDVVHVTDEFITPAKASLAAWEWIRQQGGRDVGRPSFEP